MSASPPRSLDPRDFPRLTLFLRSAFDALDRRPSRSATQAAFEYVQEAELDELDELWAEWRRFVDLARGVPLESLNRILAERFGTSYRVSTLQDLEEAADILERALTD